MKENEVKCLEDIIFDLECAICSVIKKINYDEELTVEDRDDVLDQLKNSTNDIEKFFEFYLKPKKKGKKNDV